MIWPFKRGRRVPLPPVCEAWYVGDLAECSADTPWLTINGVETATCGPRFGSRAVVLRVYMMHGTVFLQLLGFGRVWHAAAFRKSMLRDNGADRKVIKQEPTRQENAGQVWVLEPPGSPVSDFDDLGHVDKG